MTAIDQEVGWFQVTVQDIMFVGEVDGGGCLLHPLSDPAIAMCRDLATVLFLSCVIVAGSGGALRGCRW